MVRFPITKKGFEMLEQEIKFLKSHERPAVAKEIGTAREHGDLSENAEYHAAKERQGFIEAKIAELEDKISRAEIIDTTNFAGDIVKFGATVLLLDDETQEKTVYTIVGEYEADISKNLISISSPLANALIGKKTGDFVEATVPKGTKGYQILNVQYTDYE